MEGTDINLRFIDSFKFMASSLNKLSSYLEKLDTLECMFNGFSNEQIVLLKRKGVFPYDYVSSFEKLKEPNLPSKDDFFSNLQQSFNIHDLGQYTDLYLKTDVILLAEVFENFRTNYLAAYELDPAHYYTTPGLSWDAMLKNTQVLFT